MSKDLRLRARNVEKAWEAFDSMAKTGPEQMRGRFEGYCEAVRETWATLKPALAALHTAVTKAVALTGMTLEDYLWLRDVAPPEDES